MFAVEVRRDTHFAYLLRTYTSTHLFEDGTRGAAATRKGDIFSRGIIDIVLQ